MNQISRKKEVDCFEMPPAEKSKLFCNQLRIQRSLKSHGKVVTGIIIFNNSLPCRSINFMSKGPKAVLPKSTDILSFGARTLFLNRSKTSQCNGKQLGTQVSVSLMLWTLLVVH